MTEAIQQQLVQLLDSLTTTQPYDPSVPGDVKLLARFPVSPQTPQPVWTSQTALVEITQSVHEQMRTKD
ncbi:hypothetical protein DNTS_025749 [Danionella cerebrum]|uniref:Uncharacterized protein n=1 Tax=Danionella cerebrum TaxID=2873325 RepID=A0A553Q2P7_9TELE|nr:hypothetical protein DNTS_025749 [Danionella translucida]